MERAGGIQGESFGRGRAGSTDETKAKITSYPVWSVRETDNFLPRRQGSFAMSVRISRRVPFNGIMFAGDRTIRAA